MTRPAPQILGVPSHLWCVSNHMDKIARRTYREATRTFWGSDTPLYLLRFPTEAEAIDALLKRAADRVAAAERDLERDLERERGRLKKLRKKYGAEGV